MSPIGNVKSTTGPVATLPPVSAAPAPASAAHPADTPVPSAEVPKPGAPAASGAPTTDAANAAKALVGDIKGLVTDTKGLDTVWATSALTAKAAIESLPKETKLDPAARSAIERILFSGKVMGIEIPKDAQPVKLDGKQSATDVILGAEQSWKGAVTTLAGRSVDVLKRVPDGVPKEITQILGAVRERVTDGLYAIKFSTRIAPPPAPPAAPDANGKPSQNASANAKPAPAADAKPTPAASAKPAPAADTKPGSTTAGTPKT